MPDVRIRQQIALLAARMMYVRTESEYYTAKRKAARQLGVEYRFHPGDLPSNAEIRDQIQALEGVITPRTAFLIAHHMEVHAIRDGSIGHRAKLRLEESPDYEDLLLLGEIDRAGRQRGAQVCTVEEVLQYIRDLEGEAYLQ